MGQNSNPPVYVLVSEKAGVPLRAIEKYVKYVSRTVTIVHAGTRSAHSLITSEKLESETKDQKSDSESTGGPRDGMCIAHPASSPKEGEEEPLPPFALARVEGID